MGYAAIAVVSVLLTVMLFAGCSDSHRKTVQSEISGISISQNHMNFGKCYSFYLREENGQLLFDADVRLTDEPYSIVLERCPVDKECFRELAILESRHKIVDYVNSYRRKFTLFCAKDKAKNTTTLYMKDGTDRSAESGEYLRGLYEFFLCLACKYKNAETK